MWSEVRNRSILRHSCAIGDHHNSPIIQNRKKKLFNFLSLFFQFTIPPPNTPNFSHAEENGRERSKDKKLEREKIDNQKCSEQWPTKLKTTTSWDCENGITDAIVVVFSHSIPRRYSLTYARKRDAKEKVEWRVERKNKHTGNKKRELSLFNLNSIGLLIHCFNRISSFHLLLFSLLLLFNSSFA